MPGARHRMAGDDGPRSSPTAAGCGCAVDTLEALGAFKNARALPTWELAVTTLLPKPLARAGRIVTGAAR